MPADLAQVQIFRLPRKEVDFVAAIRQPFGYLINRPGTPVPAVTIDH